MYTVTLLPWESALRETFPIATPGINERVIFHPTVAPDADEQMDTQQMVLGLYVGALTIATQERNIHNAATVTIKIRGDQLGLIYIGPPGVGGNSQNETVQLNDTVILLNVDGKPLDSTRLTSKGVGDEWGILADPSDMHFRINYRMTGPSDGRNPSDIMLAVLDFLANAAQYYTETPFRQGSGTDTRLQASAVVTVQKLLRSDPRAGLLRYHQAARAVQLLIRMMNVLDDFRTMEFDLEYRGFRFGKGSIRRPRVSLSNRTDIGTTA